MKVRALENINGVGYENFMVHEERELENELAEKLIRYRYVEAVEVQETPPTEPTENIEFKEVLTEENETPPAEQQENQKKK